MLTSHEVDILNCWEPAVKQANKRIGTETVKYAYTIEGYHKWGQAAYIPSQAVKRGNIDTIYKVMNYFLDGEYRAYQARDRAYGGPNMDLAITYAIAHNWSADDIAGLKATQAKIDRKYTKPYVATYAPTNADAIESEWQRFLSA